LERVVGIGSPLRNDERMVGRARGGSVRTKGQTFWREGPTNGQTSCAGGAKPTKEQTYWTKTGKGRPRGQRSAKGAGLLAGGDWFGSGMEDRDWSAGVGLWRAGCWNLREVGRGIAGAGDPFSGAPVVFGRRLFPIGPMGFVSGDEWLRRSRSWVLLLSCGVGGGGGGIGWFRTDAEEAADHHEEPLRAEPAAMTPG
jgi:hypothetical protein